MESLASIVYNIVNSCVSMYCDVTGFDERQSDLSRNSIPASLISIILFAVIW